VNIEQIREIAEDARIRINKEFEGRELHHAYVPGEKSLTKSDAALVALWNRVKYINSKRIVKLSMDDGNTFLADYLPNIIAELCGSFDDYDAGTTFKIEFTDMTERDLDLLPDFDGF
jgi:hypothetical protein